MTNNEIITALASLINDAGKKNQLPLDTAFNIFLDYEKTKVREATIIYYSYHWKILKKYCNALGCFTTADVTKALYNKLISLLMTQNYSNSSINKFCDLLKSILNVCVELDYITNNPLKGIKKLKEVIPDVQVVKQDVKQQIFNHLFSLPKTPLNLRNICYFLIVNDTGARLNEMINIKLKNVHLDNNSIYLEYTKTGKPRNVYIQDITVSYIKEYLKYHGDKTEYFFINTFTGEQIRKHSIYDMIAKIQKDLNIPGSISPHKWRHALATELAESNMNINRMMMVLGHTQYSTTKRYLHLNDEACKNEVLSILNKNSK